MKMEQERSLLTAYGRKLVEQNLTKGTGGNLSIFNRKEGLMAITPSGIDFFETRPEDIVLMDLDGNIVEGDRTPSSEWEMHLKEYQERDDLDSVIHAHTVYSAVMACLRKPLPAAHYMIAVAGKDVRCAEYASYGTHELAVNAFEGMKDRKAVFLANHGILTGGATIQEAFNVLVQIEYCCEVYLKAKEVGDPVILPEDEILRMEKKFKTYGQKK